MTLTDKDVKRRRVAVVIPTLNEDKHIGRTLNVLMDPPSRHFVHFVVSDGGSTDRTVDIVRTLARKRGSLSILFNPLRLQSAAFNLAAFGSGADADILVRCDAHSEYPPNFVDDLVASLERSQAASVVVCMDSVGHSAIQRAVAWTCNSIVGTGGSRHRAGRVSGYVDHGHHAAFMASAFRAVGGYDETFSHNEDAELDCRLRAAGYRIYLDANIRVQYYTRSSLWALWRQYSAYGRGRMRTLRRHPRSLRLRQFMVPLNAIFLVASCIGATVSSYFLFWPLMYIAALLSVSLYMSVRYGSPVGLLTAPVAATMHLSWAVGFIQEALASQRARRTPGPAS